MNSTAKGRRNEHRSMQFYAQQGYQTLRSAASKSTWDFIAWNCREMIFCQVKSNRMPGTTEMELIKEAIVPVGARKVCHRWNDGTRFPIIKEV